MKIRFIINPISGTGKQKNIEKLINQFFEEKNYEVHYTEAANHATALSAEAVEMGLDSVIAIGGDGTVSECAKAIIGRVAQLRRRSC